MCNSIRGGCSHRFYEESQSAKDSAGKCTYPQFRLCVQILVCTLFMLSWSEMSCAQAYQVNPPPTPSVGPRELPSRFRAPLSKAEDALDDLIARPQDLGKIQRAVSRAKSDLSQRRHYQGSGWWQTADAERRVDELLQLEKMSPEERATLAKADSMANEVDSIPIEQRRGKADKAIAEAFSAAALFKQVWGDASPVYASCLDLIAEYYHDLGRYREAEPLYQQVLEIRLRVLGDRHPDSATSLNNLGELYSDTARYQEAENLLSSQS